MSLEKSWSSLERAFTIRRPFAKQDQRTFRPIFLVMEGEFVVEAFAEGENLADLVGSSLDDVYLKNEHREIFIFERALLDQACREATLEEGDLYNQLTAFRNKLQGKLLTKSSSNSKRIQQVRNHARWDLSKENFILDVLHTWWAKVLPSRFAMLVVLNGSEPRQLLVHVAQGKLESYTEPTWRGGSVQPSAHQWVQQLTEDLACPVQSIETSLDEWNQWLASSNPWSAVAASLRKRRAKLVPFRASVLTMIVTRAVLAI